MVTSEKGEDGIGRKASTLWLYRTVSANCTVIKCRRRKMFGLTTRRVSIFSGLRALSWAKVNEKLHQLGKKENLGVQTGSGAHPASCTMGTGVLSPRPKRGRGVTLTTRPRLVGGRECLGAIHPLPRASVVVLWDCFTFRKWIRLQIVHGHLFAHSYKSHNVTLRTRIAAVSTKLKL
jgi:hypothetical protein